MSGLTLFVTSNVILQRHGDGWRATPSTLSDGQFTLDLRRAAGETEAPYYAVPVDGVMRGVVNNTVPPASGRSDVRVTFGTADYVALEGRVAPSGRTTDGWIRGPVTISGTNGPTIDCVPGTVRWDLNGPF
jgi:hypothetical protein